MNKLIFALSMARKSGRLIYGFDRVADSVKKGGAALIVLARDLSDKTREKVKNQMGDKVPVYTSKLTQFDFSAVCGRLTGILAVTDKNLAQLCKNALDNNEEGEQ